MSQKQPAAVERALNHYVIMMAAFVLAITWLIPRFLVGWFGLESPWTSYLYKYLLGTVFFFVGVFLVLKGGACNLKRPQDRYWFRFLILGLFWYISLHGLWILGALSVPFKGDL
jgi:hypothetical protein